jgi:hypothetical protein
MTARRRQGKEQQGREASNHEAILATDRRRAAAMLCFALPAPGSGLTAAAALVISPCRPPLNGRLAGDDGSRVPSSPCAGGRAAGAHQREKFCTAHTLPLGVVKKPHATLVLEVLVMLMK